MLASGPWRLLIADNAQQRFRSSARQSVRRAVGLRKQQNLLRAGAQDRFRWRPPLRASNSRARRLSLRPNRPRLPENPADTKNTRVAKPATVDFLILPDATLYFAAILMLLSSRVRFPQQWAAVLWHIRSLREAIRARAAGRQLHRMAFPAFNMTSAKKQGKDS